MAEGSECGSWWGGWVQAAKDKSAAAYEFVRKDLEEFKLVVQEDTTNVYNAIGSKMTRENASTTLKKVKEGGQSLLGTIAKSLTIPPDEDDDKGVAITAADVFDRAKARLRAIQIDPGTYLDEPEDLDTYHTWQDEFDLEGRKGDISELLVSNTEVRSLYTQMVPSSVSHADFWQRYFFKVHLLQLHEERRKEILSRVNKEDDWEEEDLGWEDVEGPCSPPKPSHMELAAAALASEKLTHKDSSDPGTKKTDASEPTSTLPCDTQLMSPVGCIVQKEIDSDSAKNLECTTGDDKTQVPSTQTDIPEPEAIPSQPEITTTQGESTAELTQPLQIQIDSPSQVSESGEELRTREKGDMVVVGSNGTTPSSGSVSSNPKDAASLDDDWEKEFDIEVTEEDIRNAQQAAAKKIAEHEAAGEGDDWESWD